MLAIASALNLPLSTSVHSQAQNVQFGLAEDAPQAQHEAIIVAARVVDPLSVGDEHPDNSGQVKQGVPVGVVARQATGLVGQNEANPAE